MRRCGVILLIGIGVLASGCQSWLAGQRHAPEPVGDHPRDQTQPVPEPRQSLRTAASGVLS